MPGRPEILVPRLRRGSGVLGVLAVLATGAACTSGAGAPRSASPSAVTQVSSPAIASASDTSSAPVALPSASPTTSPTSSPTQATTPAPNPEVQRLGSDSAVRAATLKGPHPGLKKICQNRFAIDQIARVVITTPDRSRAEYAAVLITCHMATGSSPEDVSIVKPSPDGPMVAYRIVNGTETYRDFYMQAVRLSSSPGRVTIIFHGLRANESPAVHTHRFARTFIIGVKSARSDNYSPAS